MRQILGFNAGPGLVFPYPGCNGKRVKPDNPFTDQNGRVAKYLSAKGASNHFYIQEQVAVVFKDTRVALFFVEGEKKTLKGCQEKLFCIGIPGVWSWKQNGKPIRDFDLIEWKNRQVYIVFDSDAFLKYEVRLAEYRLWEELRRRKTNVKVIRLKGAPGQKVGLDDYLLTHSVDTFCQLPAIVPKEPNKQTFVIVDEAVTFIEEEIKEEEPIISDGILPKKSVQIISGISKVGKTVLALNEAIAIATGKPFLLQFDTIKPCRVLYLQAEVARVTMQERLQKMFIEMSKPEPTMLNIITKKGLKLTNRKHFEALREYIEYLEPEVLFLDPVRPFFTGDENKSSDVGAFLDQVDVLIDLYGISVVLIHHHGKQVEGQKRQGAQAIRGSSVFFDHGDSYLSLTYGKGDEKGKVKLEFDLRNAEAPHPMMLYRDTETLCYHILDMAVDAKSKVTDADIIEILQSQENEISQKELISLLRTKTGASERRIKDAISNAERIPGIETRVDEQAKGRPKFYWVEGEIL